MVCTERFIIKFKHAFLCSTVQLVQRFVKKLRKMVQGTKFFDFFVKCFWSSFYLQTREEHLKIKI